MRIPVISSDQQPLMPIKPSRARKWIRDGKAIVKFNYLERFYVQLVNEPSGIQTQSMVIGIDLGKLYSGGIRRKYGGSTTRHGVRKGDLVKFPKGVGYVSGNTETQISVSEASWKRLGQIASSKVQPIRRSYGLIVA
jgi:hypothetical protein